MTIAETSLALLGYRASDKVTGYSGVITSISFDLYGCVQGALTPPAPTDGKPLEFGQWFDIHRLELEPMVPPVMPLPDFNAYGATPGTFSHGASPKSAPR